MKQIVITIGNNFGLYLRLISSALCMVFSWTVTFFRATIFLYSPCHYMRAWIRVLDAPGCYEKVRTTRLRTGQNCRAVCTKSSASGHRYVQLDVLLNDWRESAARLLSRQARSVACSLSCLLVVR